MSISTATIDRLAPIAIVLVSPQGARNLGSIARVMKNMGLSRLTIVAPECDPHGEEARRMAVHAFDILKAARIVETIPEAIADANRTIATTGRTDIQTSPLLTPEVGLPWLLDAPSALMFGPESRGLSNDELAYAQRLVSIPTTEAYSSLNLAQAVGICARDLVRAAPSDDSPPDASIPPISVDRLSGEAAAPVGQIEGYYDHLERVLLDIGYLHPHTASARMKKFRRLLNRAQPSGQEVAMLRGILRQMEWASRNGGSGSDSA
ncbi:MAG: RNA methyltransferase [Geitlerinemataceae cyanobacterium]